MTTLNLAGTRSSHRWAEPPGNFDALNCRAIYPSTNQWGIPDLTATTWTPARLVAYNSRAEIAKAGNDAAVHFFLDDYRFETVWTKPERGLSRIRSVGSALTPDFSLWRDMPVAMQVWQVYRSRWCGAWLLHHGVKVIPTLSWSAPNTYDFAFVGIESASVVAISAVGVRDAEARQLFSAGLSEMVDRLRPSTILCYGRMPEVQLDVPIHCYPTRWN